MKNITKTLIVALIVFAGSGLAKAQQKIAYLYSDSLIAIMPEAKKADTAVQQYVKKFETELVKREERIKKLEGELQASISQNGGREPNDAIYQLNRKDYEDELGKYQQIQQDAQNQVAMKRQELYEPIIKKAKEAIAQVAKEKGYTYVLDASIGTLLYATPGENILDEVKKKLGIK